MGVRSAKLSQQDITNASFSRSFVFPRGGTYLVGVDYAQGLRPESDHAVVSVDGVAQDASPLLYDAEGVFDGYEVSLSHGLLLSGEPATLVVKVTREGRGVFDLIPYLGAAMHVAIVKNDLSEFIHTHGEVHTPGVQNRTTATPLHVHVPPPREFGPMVEAHTLFPDPGLYTVFVEFAHEEQVVVARFTVSVE